MDGMKRYMMLDPRTHTRRLRPAAIAGFIAALTLALTLLSAVLTTGTATADDTGSELDLDRITRLVWMGSEPPVSYEEYMAGRVVEPFNIRRVAVPDAVFEKNDAILTGGRAGGKALVVVNEFLRSYIETNLNRYVADLAAQGYTVELHETSGGTAEEMKSFILANKAGLRGVVFVGHVPVPWFEMEHDFGDGDYADFPCDLYYMELDAVWTDTDSNGKFDLVEPDPIGGDSSDEGPEIFVGHIDASMITGDSEANLVNAYFDKNHSWWNGSLMLPEYGLTYTEDDWSYWDDFLNDIGYAYEDYQVIAAPDTDRDDYVLTRLPDAGYEFIQLSCHSWSGGHAFTRGGYAYSSDIRAAVPQALYYNLFCCSASRWVETNHLGGMYIFNTSTSSLATLGSSKTGSMLGFWQFYQPFGDGECLGDAFRIWFDCYDPFDPGEMGWFFGMTIQGDPFLTRRHATLDASLTCEPAAGIVPFDSAMTVILRGIYPGDFPSLTRRMAAHIDVTIANGTSYSNWKSGFTNIPHGSTATVIWQQRFQALGSVVGTNRFQLLAEDVTPSPYNLPPYPPSGDTDTDTCVVAASAP